jgi:mannose-1-phosphate guanylyltransferase
MENYYITIMAGGIGSRFWPSSTEKTPKQFLDILGVGKSLLRLTFERFLNVVPAERILILTNQQYKQQVMEHLPELSELNILCEPSRNNTGPCVAYTALRLFAQNKNAIFVTAPSDAVILKTNVFVENIKKALKFVELSNAIVTLGIQPTRPDTGYGYIEVNKEDTEEVLKVNRFREKPNLDTAKEYLAAGNYYWNAGIFVWKAQDLIESFKTNAPDIISTLSKDISKINTAEEQDYINEVYPLTPSISVDYAILEKADNVYTIPSDIGWSDLGTWNSLHAYLRNDANEVISLGANTYIKDSSNCLIRTDSDKIVVVKGLDDYIVVDEPGGLLIYPKSDEQEIKAVLKEINEKA